MSYSPQGHKESDTTHRLNSNKCIGHFPDASVLCLFVLCSVSRPSHAVFCVWPPWNPAVSHGRCGQEPGEGGGQSSGSASSLWAALLKEVVALWRVLALGRWCAEFMGFRNTPSNPVVDNLWIASLPLITWDEIFPIDWPGQHLFSGLDPHRHSMLIFNSFSFRKQNRKLFCSSKV